MSLFWFFVFVIAIIWFLFEDFKSSMTNKEILDLGIGNRVEVVAEDWIEEENAVKESENADDVPVFTDESIESMQEVNGEIVGVIEIPGTNIYYPICQTSDNEFYLTHGPNGKYNRNGAIFMDCTNTGFDDSTTYLYGHNMNNGSMFAGVNNYLEDTYLEQYKKIIIYSAEGVFEYEVLCVEVVDGEETLPWYSEGCMLALVTCNDDRSKRTILWARRESKS